MLVLCAANTAYLAGLDAACGNCALVGGLGGSLMQQMRDNGVKALSVDERGDELAAISAPLSAGVVLQHSTISRQLAEWGATAVLPFKSGPSLAPSAHKLGLAVLAADAKLTRRLENKLALPEIAAAADARIPDTVTVRVDADFVSAAERGDILLPRIFQPAVGFAGTGTILARSAKDFARELEARQRDSIAGKLVEYVPGQPLTVNGVVVQNEVLVGRPAYQLTGVSGLTPTEFGSCGNDWALPIARDTIIHVRSLAFRLGDELAARGFAGAFGIDVVIPEVGGLPILIEINPRWTASLAVQVQTQLAAGLPTFLDAHLAAFGFEPDQRTPIDAMLEAYGRSDSAACVQSGLGKITDTSTAISFNTSGQSVTVPQEFQPGVYRVQRGGINDGDVRIERVRDGWRLTDISGVDECVILPSSSQRPVDHGGFLARVITQTQAVENSEARTLTTEYRSLMQAVLEVAYSGSMQPLP